MLKIRNRYLFVSDLCLLAAAPFAAAAIRFEGLTWSIPDRQAIMMYGAVSVALKLGLFLSFGMYGRLWRQASVPDMTKIVQATTTSAVACAALGLVLLPASHLTPTRLPISVAILDAFLSGAIVSTPRLFIRALGTWQEHSRPTAGKRTLIVGAGAAGDMILRELLKNPQLNLTPVGFADDDPQKQSHRLYDLPVLGRLSAIPAIIAAHRIEEIVIAMPSAPGAVVRRVVRAAMDAQVPTRTVPALFEILSGRVSLSQLRKVEIQDLLRREPVQTDLEGVRAIVTGRSVLVTGAGGSIGSELARQLARLEPAHLALLGNGENEIFDIQQELKSSYPSLQVTPVIADVRDRARLASVFHRLRPHACFHAAAHKHVPLMEDNVADAVTNNVFGTACVVGCAVEYDTQHVVFISTDKAVRPTSVMGATKRVAEMVVQRAARKYSRNFVSVRFGNVLGSRCSVVPIFLSQIRTGGPVTITHPDMRRYFMTIPEAVQLVLQASALGHGGEVYVLDMGEPIRIADLAADLIRLSGLEIGRDIEIRYTGIRPGERLYEEPFFRDEEVAPTGRAKILRATNNHVPADVGQAVESLVIASRACHPDEELRGLLKTLVPDFGETQAPEDHRERPRGAVGGRISRAHGPSSRVFVERRAGAERRLGERRLGLIPPAVERRGAAERRRPLDRRVTEVALGPAPGGTVAVAPRRAAARAV